MVEGSPLGLECIVTPDEESYIRRRFSEANVETKPFSYLVIRDVLPPDIYREMEATLPPLKSGLKAFIREALPRQIRGLIFPLPPAQSFFYVSQRDTACSKGMEPLRSLWLERFGDHISLVDELLHAALNSPEHVEGNRIFYYRPTGWAVNPHHHNEQELLNALIYFPTSDNWADQGTVIYRKIPGACPTNGAYSRHTVEPTGIVPYVPNCLIAWINSPDTIHGSIEIEGAPARRYFFMSSMRQ